MRFRVQTAVGGIEYVHVYVPPVLGDEVKKKGKELIAELRETAR